MEDTKKHKILVAIPAHNEHDTILGVVKGITNEAVGLYLEVVVFDDASNDGMTNVLHENKIRSYRINKSFGLGHVFSKITQYFLENDYTSLITIDGDGQFDPKDLQKIIRPILENEASMVTGSRFINGANIENISLIKKLGNKVGARYISSVLKERFFDVTCGFRAYSRDAILRLHTFSDFTYTQEVFLNLGFKKLQILEVPISTMYFKERKSKMTKSVFRYIYKSVKIILKSMLIYSPMKLFSSLAAIALALGFSGGVFVFFWNITNDTVTPFKWLAITVVILGSLAVFLYCVGILLQITSRLQLTLENSLYYQKRNQYGDKS